MFVCRVGSHVPNAHYMNLIQERFVEYLTNVNFKLKELHKTLLCMCLVRNNSTSTSNNTNLQNVGTVSVHPTDYCH